MITAGINEKAGGATDRSDPKGRLRLLDTNAEIYRHIVPQIVRAAPRAVLLVVTDPPDPLADVARTSAGHDRVLSTGTFLDSLRFRFHLAEHFDVDANQVEAQVIGEHGTSQVFLWSSVRIAGVPISTLMEQRGETLDGVRKQIEKSVRYANITIIEGNEASQFGIGIVSARIASQSVVITVGLGAGARRQNRQTILSKRSIASKSGAFRRLGEFDLPADPHTGNFLSPIIRHDNEGSIPAVVLRQFPGNNESVRRSIVDAGTDR